MSEFHNKHIGPSQREIDEMLQYLGCNSLNDLLEKIVPKNILDIDDPVSYTHLTLPTSDLV